MGIHFTNIFAVFKADIAEAEGIAKALSATSALIATQITISEEIVSEKVVLKTT